MTARRTSPSIAILGTGFAGLCVGIQLLRAGITSFTIFEKASGPGGTWRDNTYPGAACDIPSHFYSFSFDRRADWSRAYARQPEILAYLEGCVDTYGLAPYIRYDTEITSLHYDDERNGWHLTTATGEQVPADVVVSGLGQLNRPAYPTITGLHRFAGPAFHSARWDHDVDLTGQRVGVIGTGASAVQFIPPVARQAGHLTVFQRTPNWVIPKQDRAFSERTKARFARHPGLERSLRWLLYGVLEINFNTMRRRSKVGAAIEAAARMQLKQQVPDPELRSKLTPDFPVGCKRVLIASDFFPSLAQPNTTVCTETITEIDPTGVRTIDGEHHDLDVLVFGTGFTSTEFLAPMEVIGRNGVDLNDAWRDGAEAYLGITVSGFPNLFLLYGPNTNLGHNSIVFMIEAQTRYLLHCIDQMQAGGLQWIDVRADAMSEFNTALQRAVDGTVWGTSCTSWYKNAAGKVTNNWPRHTYHYWWLTRRADLSAYHSGRDGGMTQGNGADTTGSRSTLAFTTKR